MVKSQRMQSSWLLAVADLAALWKKSSGNESTKLEQVYKATINNMASGVIVLDADNTVLNINQQAKQIIHGISATKDAEGIVGQSIRNVLSMWPNLVAYLYSSNKEYNVLLKCDRESERRYYDVQIEPVFEEDLSGRKGGSRAQELLVGRFIVLQDHTEREKAIKALQERKQQLRSMVEQLRKADRYQATLADSVQQELRAPLDNLKTIIDDLQQNAIPEHLKSSIEHLQQEARAMREIVDEMDAFTQHRRPPSFYTESAGKSVVVPENRQSYRTESFH